MVPDYEAPAPEDVPLPNSEGEAADTAAEPSAVPAVSNPSVITPTIIPLYKRIREHSGKFRNTTMKILWPKEDNLSATENTAWNMYRQQDLDYYVRESPPNHSTRFYKTPAEHMAARQIGTIPSELSDNEIALKQQVQLNHILRRVLNETCVNPERRPLFSSSHYHLVW